jgi:hypothetical protein
METVKSETRRPKEARSPKSEVTDRASVVRAPKAVLGCTGLSALTLPDYLTSIGTSGFYSCSGLTAITIPKSVISIGYSAFRYCSSLTGAYFEGNAPGADSYVINQGGLSNNGGSGQMPAESRRHWHIAPPKAIPLTPHRRFGSLPPWR